MAYRVFPDGSIETDSLDEAIALSRRLRVERARDGAEGAQAVVVSTSAYDRAARELAVQHEMARMRERHLREHLESNVARHVVGRWERFLSLLSPLAIRALHLIKDKQPISVDQLRIELKLDTNTAVTGVLAGIHKNANRVGYEPESVYVRAMSGGRDGTPLYAPGPILRVESLPPLASLPPESQRSSEDSNE